MPTKLIDTLVSWPTFIIALTVFGFAPGAVSRLVVLAFPGDDPRREELIAELYAVPCIERPFWVAQQMEVALFEGLWGRVVWAATGRVIYRWHLESGVKLNRAHPKTFWIPSEAEKEALAPGAVVKLLFGMRDGWGERMWVDVTAVKGKKITGTLRNHPIAIPHLHDGDKINFTAEHIIDILNEPASDYTLALDVEQPAIFGPHEQTGQP